jgi:hypothetical protein
MVLRGVTLGLRLPRIEKDLAQPALAETAT